MARDRMTIRLDSHIRRLSDPNVRVYLLQVVAQSCLVVLLHLQAESQVLEEHIQRIDRIQSAIRQDNTLCCHRIEVSAKKQSLAEANQSTASRI